MWGKRKCSNVLKVLLRTVRRGATHTTVQMRGRRANNCQMEKVASSHLFPHALLEALHDLRWQIYTFRLPNGHQRLHTYHFVGRHFFSIRPRSWFRNRYTHGLQFRVAQSLGIRCDLLMRPKDLEWFELSSTRKHNQQSERHLQRVAAR